MVPSNNSKTWHTVKTSDLIVLTTVFSFGIFIHYSTGMFKRNFLQGNKQKKLVLYEKKFKYTVFTVNVNVSQRKASLEK